MTPSPRDALAVATAATTLGKAVTAIGDAVRTADATGDEPVRVLVLGGCGHWWRESRPAEVKIRPDQPRVCCLCKPNHPAAVGTSPQGMAMVRVAYLPDPGRETLP
ncbi:hypothetical protein [Micromonospora sp. CA-248212]|uniref:hypothetical protein n=1 Tax=Micromonospora sp. CA-248212 TaxID=3239961 RepID=UPI003D8F4EE0